jgi:hypothetical protein
MKLPSRAAVPWLLVGFAFVVAALPPLHEMDLAQHLAMGEWIAQNGRVPFTEPFAWTRAGQPYFAYSWLPQLIFYWLLATIGPLGLHLLVGALLATAVAGAMWAARQFGWRPAACLLIGVLYLALVWGVANTLRPQQFLFALLPFVWGVAARMRAQRATPRQLIALAALGALAANSHIFFPLTAIPIAFFALSDEDGPLRWLPAAAALLIGWLINPYALVLPDLFALNFGHNMLLMRPPSILEFVPGFEYARARPGVIIAVAALLAAPWLAMPAAASLRERCVRALFWVGGLLAFAYAGRLVLAWWVLAFPLLGDAVDRALAAAEQLRIRARDELLAGFAAIVLIAAAPSITPVFWQFEGDTVHRMLPRGGEDPALWLPSWLLCNTRAGANGRIFTEFNYGSEINWRLPRYSPSIDGRTIFPDSDAVEFSFQQYGRRRQHATTWTHADLVLIDRSFWLAPVLDQQPDWVLLAQTHRTARNTVGGLWAKREWWQRWGTQTPLPALDLRVGDPRGTCALTGTFPRT